MLGGEGEENDEKTTIGLVKEWKMVILRPTGRT